MRLSMTCALVLMGCTNLVRAAEFDLLYYYDGLEDQEGTAYGWNLGRVDEETDTTHVCDPDAGGPSFDFYCEGLFTRGTWHSLSLIDYSQGSYVDYKLGGYSNASNVKAHVDGFASTGGQGVLGCTETGVATGSIEFSASGNGQLAHTEARQNLFASFGESQLRAVYAPPPTNLWTVTGTLSKFPFQNQVVNETYQGYDGLDGESWSFAEPVLDGLLYYSATQANYNEENRMYGWSSGSGSVLNRYYSVNLKVNR